MTALSRTITTRAARYKPLIEEGLRDGLTREGIAIHTGLSTSCLDRYIRLLELPRPTRKIKGSVHDDRDQEILELRKQGLTLREIGERMAITRERVRQVLARKFPDIALGTKVATVRICWCCGKQFTPLASHHKSCSLSCRSASRVSKKWNRDFALEVMRLRDAGQGWASIGLQLMPHLTTASFRSALQPQLPILFSSEERARYFPPKQGQRFRTPSGALTSNS